MNLVLFNFEMDKDSKALAFAIDWVNEIAKNVDKLYVISLRCKEYKVRENVEVFCVNQDKKNRFQTIISIWNILKEIHKKDKIDGYFVHMAHYFVPIIYPFVKYYNQKIVLWYAHKSTPFSLKIAVSLADKIISVSFKSMRIDTPKFKAIGHGIDIEKFPLKQTKSIKNIATIGRISKIKNTKEIIKSFIELNKNDLKLYVVGDILGKEDENYLKEIKKISNKNVIFTGNIPFEKLPEFYKNIDLAINLSDTGSLDKAIIEPMAMGIPVITSNESAFELFKHLDNKGVFLTKKEKLKEKLEFVLNNQNLIDSKSLKEEIAQNHSLSKLAKKIVEEFK